jgi:CRISPR-associated endonuclease Cas1
VLRLDGNEQPLPSKTRTIIAAGQGFAVTIAAVKACIAANVELLISDDAATFVSLFGPEPRANTVRNVITARMRQFAAVFDPEKTAALARAIVSRKIKAEGHPRPVEREFLAALQPSRTVMDARAIEAKAAEAYWRRWYRTEIKFKGAVPDAWRVFSQRMVKRRGGKLGEKGAQFGARDATHPANAALNYAYAIASARMTRVIIARGLDPAFGFLHAAKPGRMSLTYDCLELPRPALTDSVMQWMASRAFRKEDFGLFEGGVVRLSSATARELTAFTIKAVPLARYVEVVREIERLL